MGRFRRAERVEMNNDDHLAAMGIHEIGDDGKPIKKKDRVSARARHLRQSIRPAWGVSQSTGCEYVVKNWFGLGAFSVLYGEPGSGKTFLALDLALHVAAHVEWRGNRVNGGPVIYVAAEGGGGFGNRCHSWFKAHPELWDAVRRNFFALPEALDLCGSDDAADLARALSEAMRPRVEGVASEDLPADPVLIVIDTLARVLGGGDENSGQDMGRLVGSVGLLQKQTGAHVLLVHHSGKDTARGARGHSSLKAAVDTEIELVRDDGIITATARKQRDMPIGAAFTYRLRQVELGTDDDGDPVTSCIVEPCQPPETTRRNRVSGKPLIALQALGEALVEHGRRIDSPNLPACPVVNIEQWREMCDRQGLTDSDSADARKKAFQRARGTLHEKGIIRQFDGFVWRTDTGTERDKQGQSPSVLAGDGQGQHPIGVSPSVPADWAEFK